MSCGWYPVVPAKCCQEEPPWSSAGITWACTGTTNTLTRLTTHSQAQTTNSILTLAIIHYHSRLLTHSAEIALLCFVSPFRLNSIIYANIQNPPRNFAHHSHQLSDTGIGDKLTVVVQRAVMIDAVVKVAVCSCHVCDLLNHRMVERMFRISEHHRELYMY